MKVVYQAPNVKDFLSVTREGMDICARGRYVIFNITCTNAGELHSILEDLEYFRGKARTIDDRWFSARGFTKKG